MKWAIAHSHPHIASGMILWLTVAYTKRVRSWHKKERVYVVEENDRGRAAMNAQELLQEISDYCRQAGLAESTFGRRAVNDGKLDEPAAQWRTHHHRDARSHPHLHDHPQWKRAARPMIIERSGRPARHRPVPPSKSPPPMPTAPTTATANFRFFDNRQKYLLFVNTCSEKWVVANKRRAGARQHSSAPAGRAPVRCGPRRRHRADARDARDASPLSEHAVLYLRQGDQPGGHPADAREDAGPSSSSIRRRCWC